MVPFNVTGTLPPDADSLRRFSYAATTIILFLSTLTLALRFVARWKLQSGLELDDYLIIVGYLVSLDPSICIYISTCPGPYPQAGCSQY